MPNPTVVWCAGCDRFVPVELMEHEGNDGPSTECEDCYVAEQAEERGDSAQCIASEVAPSGLRLI